MDILDKVLKGTLVLLFLFGSLQFLYLATATLFGFYFDWKQYLASAVLLIVGLFSIWLFIKMIPEMPDEA